MKYRPNVLSLTLKPPHNHITRLEPTTGTELTRLIATINTDRIRYYRQGQWLIRLINIQHGISAINNRYWNRLAIHSEDTTSDRSDNEGIEPRSIIQY